MPDVLIKDLPGALQRRLKEEAKTNHRSMSQEIRRSLEAHLGRPGVPDLKAFVFSESLTDSYVKKARVEGRA